MSDVETPHYDIITKAGSIELRDYAPIILAQVDVAGKRSQAISDGFRILADYISGNNAQSQKMAMTAPVQQQFNQLMTQPEQKESDDSTWTVSFVMPSEHPINALPQPQRQDIELEAVPAKRWLAIRFSGTTSDNNVFQHEKELEQYINDHQIATRGTFKYAFYNAPWTLPTKRRNEVMIEVEHPPAS